MIFSPQEIAAIISVLGIIGALAGSWFLLQYKQHRFDEEIKAMKVEHQSLKEKQASFLAAIQDIKLSEQKLIGQRDLQAAKMLSEIQSLIKSEFESIIGRMNAIVFDDNYVARYVLKTECDKCKERCRKDILERIEEVNKRAHT